jgi:hypothetical protein
MNAIQLHNLNTKQGSDSYKSVVTINTYTPSKFCNIIDMRRIYVPDRPFHDRRFLIVISMIVISQSSFSVKPL